MDLNPHQARGRDSANLQIPPSSASEIELYDDLLTFTDLPPEERECQFVDSSNVEQSEASSLEANPELEVEKSSPRDEETSRSFTSPEECEPGRVESLDSPFTGAMSPGICVNCGAESGSEDLFCESCAAFVDEVGRVLLPAPACYECGLATSSDELFCPRCGAVLPSS